MDKVILHDKSFVKILDSSQIQNKVKELAKSILNHYKDINSEIHILSIMNGAFIFSADLLRELDQRFTIQFVHISSYDGVTQNSDIKFESTIDWATFQGKNVLIVEDIIESGNTLTKLISQFNPLELNSLMISCLVIKPYCVKVNFKDLIVGFEIDDEFIVGYGMDYNGLGRGLKNIYQLEK